MNIPHYLLMILIICAFYTDIRASRIPNSLTLTFAAIGLLYYLIAEGWMGLLFSFIGLFSSMVILLFLYYFRALGAGDVKLFGAIGACMGIEFTLYSLMYSVIFAGIIGLMILFIRKQFLARMLKLYYYFIGILIRRNMASVSIKNLQGNLTFPFMYAVLPGIVTTGYYFLI